MKKNVFAIFAIFVVLVLSAVVVFGGSTGGSSDSVERLTVEQARKIALKKVEGTVEEEYTIEDDDENITSYVFIIKNKKNKSFEVHIDANDGAVLSVEEIIEYDEDEDPGVAYQSEPASTDDDVVVVDLSVEDDDVEPAISMETARGIALGAVPGEIRGESVVAHDGKVTYTFDIFDGEDQMIQVKVDGETGQASKVDPGKTE